jgi:hypothetical protein
MHLGHHKCILPDHAKSEAPSAPSAPRDSPGWTQTTLYQWIQGALQSPDLDTQTEPPSARSPASPPSDTIPISFEDMRKDLLTAQVAIINYCIKHSYPLQRWKRGVLNVMILKEPGNIKIHRLRVLHGYEADFSALLAIKWRHLLYHAVNNTTLFHSEQYGGIPGRDSLAIPFIKEMQMEITCTSRYPIVKIDFDATSCYDRIPPNLASLACRGLGMAAP